MTQRYYEVPPEQLEVQQEEKRRAVAEKQRQETAKLTEAINIEANIAAGDLPPGEADVLKQRAEQLKSEISDKTIDLYNRKINAEAFAQRVSAENVARRTERKARIKARNETIRVVAAKLPASGIDFKPLMQLAKEKAFPDKKGFTLQQAGMIPKAIWQALTPWEETKETFGQFVLSTPKRMFNPDIPSQELLKAQYENDKTASLWAKILFSPSVIKDPKSDTYYQLVLAVPPEVGSAKVAKVAKALTKTIPINPNKVLAAAKKENAVIDWRKIADAIKRGKIKDAFSADKFAKANPPSTRAKNLARWIEEAPSKSSVIRKEPALQRAALAKQRWIEELARVEALQQQYAKQSIIRAVFTRITQSRKALALTTPLINTRIKQAIQESDLPAREKQQLLKTQQKIVTSTKAQTKALAEIQTQLKNMTQTSAQTKAAAETQTAQKTKTITSVATGTAAKAATETLTKPVTETGTSIVTGQRVVTPSGSVITPTTPTSGTGETPTLKPTARLPIPPAGSTDEEKRKFIKKHKKGTVTYNMGKLHGKDVWHVRFDNGQELVVLGAAPAGVRLLAEGKGSTEKTTQRIGGGTFAPFTKRHGAVTATVRPTATQKGATIGFKSVKKGRQYFTKIGKSTAISRRPLGKR